MSLTQEKPTKGCPGIPAEILHANSVPQPSAQMYCAPDKKNHASDCLQADIAGLRVGTCSVFNSTRHSLSARDGVTVIRALVAGRFRAARQEAKSALARDVSTKRSTDVFPHFVGAVEGGYSTDELTEQFIASLQVSPPAGRTVNMSESGIVFDQGDGYVLAVVEEKVVWRSAPEPVATDTRLIDVTDKSLISRLTDAYLEGVLTRSCHAKYRQYLHEYRIYGDSIENISERMALAGPML